jgi:hypothetical protein
VNWTDLSAGGIGFIIGLLVARWTIHRQHRFRINLSIERERGEDASRKVHQEGDDTEAPPPVDPRV